MLSLGHILHGIGTNRSIEMIKILVTSTIEMTEQEFFAYAQSIHQRYPKIKSNEFAEEILSGGQVNIDFKDGTNTTYEAILNLQ